MLLDELMVNSICRHQNNGVTLGVPLCFCVQLTAADTKVNREKLGQLSHKPFEAVRE